MGQAAADTSSGTANQELSGSIWVAWASSAWSRTAKYSAHGTLVVIYYDTVGDAGRLKTDVWMQRSTDDGATWSTATKVTSAQNC